VPPRCEGPAYQLGQFLVTVGIGLAGAVVGIALLWFLLRKLRLGEPLGTSAQLACVIGVAAACDIAREDAGLLAAIIMGLAVANMPGFDVPARRPFLETLVQLMIACCWYPSPPPSPRHRSATWSCRLWGWSPSWC